MSKKQFEKGLGLLVLALGVITLIEWIFISVCGGLSAL